MVSMCGPYDSGGSATTAVTSARSDAMPVPCSGDKMSGDGQYSDPPSKYNLTRHMYDSTHYGVGSMMVALT
jgi:hypothetical protein